MKVLNRLGKELSISTILALYSDIEYLTDDDVKRLLKESKRATDSVYYLERMIPLYAGLNREGGMEKREL